MIGVAIATFIASQDYRLAERLTWPFYGGVVVLLVLVALFGTEINGSQRWISFGEFSLQPSELAKLAVILITAHYFSRKDYPDGIGVRDILVPVFFLLIPSALIINQPDLGTTIVLWLIFATMVVFERVRWTLLVTSGLGVCIGLPVLWVFVMKAYQKDRVRAFLNPETELQGDAWQVNQSKIAVGSGRWFGKGWLQGTQVQGGFVPYHENDFIFTHHGEQFGFIGSLLLLVLYAGLIVVPLWIARRARDRFAVLCCVGISALFFWHVVINLGMVTGLLPVVGLWLPFASRGGTAILTLMLCVGILMSISMRRKQNT
jgi:rod shape determining protein RodA